MKYFALKSTNLRAIGYNADCSQARVIFHNGTAYDYFDIDQATVDAIRTAESPGKQFNATLKGKGGEKIPMTPEIKQAVLWAEAS